MGTFGGALEARGIPARGDRLVGEASGEVEVERGVLVLRRIVVTYRLRIDGDQRDAVERVHAVHHSKCPVYQSIHGAIEIATTYRIERADAE